MSVTSEYPKELVVKNKDYLNGAKNDSNLGLLLAVSVLSTLLVVSLVAWLTWLCVKCCGPSCKRRNFRKHDSFPRHHRDLMGLPWVENSVNSSLGNRGYAPERTGISERLGYGRNSRLASVPYLPPPRSWTPSPPFPPEGLVPPKQRLIQPNPRNRLPRDGLQKVDEETNLEGNENQLSLGMGICQFCGSFQVCPVVLNKKMFYTQQHQPKTVNSELRSAEIRPGGSTSMKSFRSQPIIEKKIYFKEDVAECEEGKKEECYELCNVVKRRENKSWTARHPQKLITTNPKNSWRVFQSDQTGPFPDLQKLDKLIYHTRNKNDVGVDEKEFKELDGRRINPGCCEPQKVMTSGSVPVIIESPSSLSLLDMYQNGLKSQKEPRMYWKLYNDENPQAVSSPTRATCRAADMKDDFYDMVPSMSWDHLNPDLSTVLDPSGRPSTWGNVVVDVGAQKASFHASRKTETGAQDPEISRTEI